MTNTNTTNRLDPISEAHRVMIKYLTDNPESYGSELEEESLDLYFDTLADLGWRWSDDEKFCEYALKATERERVDFARQRAQLDRRIKNLNVVLSWDGDHDDWTGTLAQMRKDWGETNLFDSAENDGGLEWSCSVSCGTLDADCMDEVIALIQPGDVWTAFNCSVRLNDS